VLGLLPDDSGQGCWKKITNHEQLTFPTVRLTSSRYALSTEITGDARQGFLKSVP